MITITLPAWLGWLIAGVAILHAVKLVIELVVLKLLRQRDNLADDLDALIKKAEELNKRTDL